MPLTGEQRELVDDLRGLLLEWSVVVFTMAAQLDDPIRMEKMAHAADMLKSAERHIGAAVRED